ncbi:sigma-70 family RNA polymerase sigma factor [Sulfuriroseicoccus oceanibius]|uniref:Sigma-70 family RNA polymerase sigma factor n=1 Tax=Sulfuriroseicoccus oceanibius TaxID=2707525 RepID=A0A6B3L6M1_9BACT|nr:sigma-70 family RNA polymerase sigma factor [Sulfuriroseicoccus oceanibius]QQL45860.1 sigma-70 family RNA polymerase sigma factor [Sulfuriroseicoccus oceanibius]
MSSSPEHFREFVSLLTSHQSALRGFIVSLLPGLPGASDVLQDVNVILWEKRAAFEIGSNFRAWAFKIARYETLNYRRRLQRDGVEMLNPELIDLMAAEYERRPELTERRLEALQHCLEGLQPQHRELIEGRYMSASSLVDYAARVGRSAGGLRVALHRLRASLRKCVESKLVVAESRV